MGPTELVIVGIIAILLFGKRLPEVAKSLGSSYREFRKGLNSLQSEIDFSDTNYNSSSYDSGSSSYGESVYDEYEDHDEATAPKFEPPATAPQEQETSPTQEIAPSESPTEPATEEPKADQSQQPS